MNGINDRIFNLLTICRKAGRMTMGFDPVKESILEKKAKLILTASDISAKTEKEIRFFAEKTQVPVLATPASMQEYEFGIGKKVGVIAICDEGFSKKMTELIGAE